ncbi:isoprenoid synthase domain-containing protein [Mycena rosella]|uniref:Isoprenoid synthase domain-containing protein n=1 Tax=Mycena rosella TaxID=1033263 RepID=A0AAD7GD45_MYCRO|nr:isoprenoid synthase domain-containing protein [Mycena rosella]
MPSIPSIQLPDLLSLGRAFDLRTNRHCHAVTYASEQWFATQRQALSDTERAALRSLKIGLWASTCFPTSDPPQLRLATDFLTSLVTCNGRLVHARTLRDCGWTDERSHNGWECLSGNVLFQPLMQRLTSAMSSDTSRGNFGRSSEAFRTAQMQILAYRQNHTLPNADAYVELRRDLSGMPMVFDLLEMTEGLPSSSRDEPCKSFNHLAADMIALSMDIFAYNNDQFNGNDFNIVSIIRTEKGVSAQGAINCAFDLIANSFQKFFRAESALFLGQSPPSPTSAWTWNLLGRKEPPLQATLSQLPPAHDAGLYLRGLKDCIIGTMNWSYETDLYFGSKGDEVRQFGWVFLKPRSDEQ